MNFLKQIRQAIKGKTFKVEIWEDDMIFFNLYESEIPFVYKDGEINLCLDFTYGNIGHETIRELNQVLKILLENKDQIKEVLL